MAPIRTLSLELYGALHTAFSAFVLAAFLVGCGGGGGGPSGSIGDSGSNSDIPPPEIPVVAAPQIMATLTSFTTGAVPSGLFQTGFNSGIAVEVLDKVTGASVSNATVALNGMLLIYNLANGDYEAELNLAPGDDIALSVMVAGNTYNIAGTQFAAYPSITNPLPGSTWSSLSTNVAAWLPSVASANAVYALALFDQSGEVVGPASGEVSVMPLSSTSFSFAANSLSAGTRVLAVGLVSTFQISSAASGSVLLVSGFNSVPFTVDSSPLLVSMALSPPRRLTLPGRTVQFSAIGTYSDNSTRDLTAQVSWASSDTAKATVSATGLASGIASGTANITANLGAFAGSVPLRILPASPLPPLSQSVAYQIDPAHSGRVVFNTALAFPSASTWSTALDSTASYPLIASGKVFATTGAGSLYALDLANGNILWGPIGVGGTYSWAAHAYDQGTIFVVNFDGRLRSFDATTGQLNWSVQLPGQYAFTSPPTAVNGVVYVGGAGSGGTLYAVDQTNGRVLWTASVANGDHSSPTVSGDGVFVSYPCQAYKFDPLTGSAVWHYVGPCGGGGGRTSPYANGQLYFRDPMVLANAQILNAATGASVGSFAGGVIPALSTQTAFILNAGTLRAIDMATQNVLWSFAGDGQLFFAPIVIDQTVIAGSGSGAIYALDAATGAQIWSASAGAALAQPDEHNVAIYVGFGAGEGHLIVPAGQLLTAWRITQ